MVTHQESLETAVVLAELRHPIPHVVTVITDMREPEIVNLRQQPLIKIWRTGHCNGPEVSQPGGVMQDLKGLFFHESKAHQPAVPTGRLMGNHRRAMRYGGQAMDLARSTERDCHIDLDFFFVDAE